MTHFVNQCIVTLLDWMGDDLAVVNAARVSFDKTSSLLDGVMLDNKDAKLIAYLASHEHWTPFGHVQIKLRIACPVFVARQWMRSNVGVVRNEVSRRYVDAAPEYYLPNTLHTRPEGSIKQGAGVEHPISKSYLREMSALIDQADGLYADMIADGIAPEEARMILPLNHMTEFVETGSIAYFARVCGLRLDHHAQTAVRELAELVSAVVQPIAPVSWAALMKLEIENLGAEKV